MPDAQNPSQTTNSRALQSAGEVAARTATARVAKLASPLVLSTPVLKIATFHSSSLGGLVASLPALMALRDSFPGARLDAYARTPHLPLLRNFSGVDQALARPGGGISSQAALMARLHGAGYDLALSFSQGSNALLLLWATSAATRAGFVPSRMDALLTHKIPREGPLRALDALELVRGVGATPRGERARDFLHLEPSITQSAQLLLDKAGIEGAFLLVSSEARRGQVRRGERAHGESGENSEFPAALRALSSRFPLVLVGLKPHPALQRAVGETKHLVVDFGGQTDVLTLAALCEMARGAFGVGSGVLQLAKLFDKPTAMPRDPAHPDETGEVSATRALQIFGF